MHRQIKLSQLPYAKEKFNRGYSDFEKQQDKSVSFNKCNKYKFYSKQIGA